MLKDFLGCRHLSIMYRRNNDGKKKDIVEKREFIKPEDKKIGSKTLRKILDDHRLYVESNRREGKKADLSGQDLHGIDFSGENLFGADLSHSDISQTKCENTIFWGADISNSVLWEGDFRYSCLIGCNLSGSDLSRANFSHATMCGANLKEANFRDANFTSADMSYVNMRDCAELDRIIYSKKTILTHLDCDDDSWDTNLLLRKRWETQNYLVSFKANHKVIYHLWNAVCKCGESIGRWLIWNVVAITLFGFILKLFPQWIGWPSYDSWFTPFYYTIVTFVSLGYGEITPVCWQGQLLATFISIFGYISLGTLITIFSKKIVI